MKISICITTLNEEGNIGLLIDSLLSQYTKPDEIVVVDGGSTDRTVKIIREYQKKSSRIKLLVQKSSRAIGRNLGVKLAKNEIIAITDAGCVVDYDWLKNITKPFKNKKVDVVAGFYKMKAMNNYEKAVSVYLGILPKYFNRDFLPSTRSIAFRKSVWKDVGGFPENLDGAAEDTVFNLKLIKNKVKIARAKNATVEWGMPKTLNDFFWKIYGYAKGDAVSKIWIFPKKGLASHNIKALFVVLRYLFGLTLLILGVWYNTIPLLMILFLFYLVWAYQKIYKNIVDSKVALWGPIIQIVADLGVLSGFLRIF